MVTKKDLQKLLVTKDQSDWKIALGYIAREMIKSPEVSLTMDVEEIRDSQKQRLFVASFIETFTANPDWEALRKIRIKNSVAPIWLMQACVGIAARLGVDDVANKDILMDWAESFLQLHAVKKEYVQCYYVALLENAVLNPSLLNRIIIGGDYVLPFRGIDYSLLFADIMVRNPSAVGDCFLVFIKMLRLADYMCFEDIAKIFGRVYKSCLSEPKIAKNVFDYTISFFEAFAKMPKNRRWVDDKYTRSHTIISVAKSLDVPYECRLRLLQIGILKENKRETAGELCRDVYRFIRQGGQSLSVLREALAVYEKMILFYPLCVSEVQEGFNEIIRIIERNAEEEMLISNLPSNEKNYFGFVEEEARPIFENALRMMIQTCPATNGNNATNAALYLLDAFAYSEMFTFEEAKEHMQKIAGCVGKSHCHVVAYIFEGVGQEIDFIRTVGIFGKEEKILELTSIFVTAALDVSDYINGPTIRDFRFAEKILKQNWDLDSRFAKIKEKMAEKEQKEQKNKVEFEALKQKVSAALM